MRPWTARSSVLKGVVPRLVLWERYARENITTNPVFAVKRNPKPLERENIIRKARLFGIASIINPWINLRVF
jgi:hypothetical protein